VRQLVNSLVVVATQVAVFAVVVATDGLKW
jgi:hypothetical protein